MDVTSSRIGNGFACDQFGVRLGSDAGFRRVQRRLSGLLLPRAVLLPGLLSGALLLSCPGSRAIPARLHGAAGRRARAGLLVLLRRNKGLLPVREGMPGRMAEGGPGTAELGHEYAFLRNPGRCPRRLRLA